MQSTADELALPLGTGFAGNDALLRPGSDSTTGPMDCPFQRSNNWQELQFAPLFVELWFAHCVVPFEPLSQNMLSTNRRLPVSVGPALQATAAVDASRSCMPRLPIPVTMDFQNWPAVPRRNSAPDESTLQLPPWPLQPIIVTLQK